MSRFPRAVFELVHALEDEKAALPSVEQRTIEQLCAVVGQSMSDDILPCLALDRALDASCTARAFRRRLVRCANGGSQLARAMIQADR